MFLKEKYSLYKWVFTFLFCYVYQTNAQLFVPETETAFNEIPAFNQRYIKDKGIKLITCQIIDKKDFEVAEDKGLKHYYYFDAEGKLQRISKTVIKATSQILVEAKPIYKKRKKIKAGYSYYKTETVYDTLSVDFIYDTEDNLILVRSNEGENYDTWYYDYNDKQQMTRAWHCKETNIAGSKTTFKLGKQEIISNEYFTYQTTGKNQYKKLHKNDEGNFYEEEIINLNSENQITSINKQYVTSSIFKQIDFMYKNGKLIDAEQEGNVRSEAYLHYIYEYDMSGAILNEKKHKNDKLYEEISFINDSKTQLLTSYIIRDHLNKAMRIVKLSYTYY